MNLEEMAQQLVESGQYAILRVYAPVTGYAADDGGEKRIGVILDVETTGTDYKTDQIIELGMVKFEYGPHNGTIYRVLGHFDEYNDPGRPIPPEITRLTGITDDMVRGQRLTPEKIADFLGRVDLVIAHNAAFDRKFVEKLDDGFIDRPWACSMSQIDWKSEGINIRALDYIAYRLGFTFTHHRAVNDCYATLHVLAQQLPVSGQPACLSLLQMARQSTYRIYAVDTKYEYRTALKNRGYYWNDGSNGKHKAWFTEVTQDRLEEELNYLRTEIYHMPLISIPQEVIHAKDRFSVRA